MQKDLKTGLILGLILITAAGLWLSTRPGLSTKARMLQSYPAKSREDIKEKPDLTAGLPPSPKTTALNTKTLSYNKPETERPSSRIKAPAENIPPQSGEPKLLQPATRKPTGIIKPHRIHIVAAGETLSGISLKYYGTISKWREIFEANPSRLNDANNLRPGTRLIVPE